MSAPTFAELLASPGVVEECELRGKVGFMAYHGGALEELTDVIAREAADATDASYYTVIQPESLQVHISSIDVTPAESVALQSFVDHVEVAVSIHGYGRMSLRTSILLGGRNRVFAAHIADHLSRALPDYEMVDELQGIPMELQGIHVRNPVNLPPHAGVQIELPPRIRGGGPFWSDWKGDGLVPHTRALIDGLVAAVHSWEPGTDRPRSD